VVQDLDVPEGMGIILRTAGASRTKPKSKRDFEYLIRMWEDRARHDAEVAGPHPRLRGSSLIKRSLRDLYNKESTKSGRRRSRYQEARDFMRC